MVGWIVRQSAVYGSSMKRAPRVALRGVAGLMQKRGDDDRCGCFSGLSLTRKKAEHVVQSLFPADHETDERVRWRL